MGLKCRSWIKIRWAAPYETFNYCERRRIDMLRSSGTPSRTRAILSPEWLLRWCRSLGLSISAAIVSNSYTRSRIVRSLGAVLFLKVIFCNSNWLNVFIIHSYDIYALLNGMKLHRFKWRAIQVLKFKFAPIFILNYDVVFFYIVWKVFHELLNI